MRPMNPFQVAALLGICIYGIIALSKAFPAPTGEIPRPGMGIFVFLMLLDILLFAIAVYTAGWLVVDERGARLYKLWKRVELPWEEVRCLGAFTTNVARYSFRCPMLLISPLAEPWRAIVFDFKMQMDRNYLYFDGAYILCLEDGKALRAVIEAYCPLPWTNMDGFGERGGYRQLKRMYGSSKSGESREERTMTRGLFLRTDTDMKTVTAVWRRVMGVLCGRYPAWLLDSFDDCLGGKTDPDGAYTSREFKQWLDGEHYILFARAFGYAGEVARETVCDYEDYQRAACRCAVLCWDAGYFQVYCKDENVLEALHADAELRALCDRFEYVTDENDGRTTFCI